MWALEPESAETVSSNHTSSLWAQAPGWSYIWVCPVKVWSCIQWTVWSDSVELMWLNAHANKCFSFAVIFVSLLSGTVVGVNEIPFLFHAVHCITYNSDAPFINKTRLAYINVFWNPLMKAPVFTDNLTYKQWALTPESHYKFFEMEIGKAEKKNRGKNKSVLELHPCQWETSFPWNLRMTSCETPAVLTDSLLWIHRRLLLQRRQV